MERRVTVRGIIMKDGKLFMQKLKNGDGEKDFWCTAGGGLDSGESLRECLVREMIEETGVRPEIGKLLYVQQFDDNGKDNLDFFFHIKNADDYETIDLASTSHGELEIARYGFVDPKTEYVLPKFLREVDIADDIASDRAAQDFAYYGR